MNYKYRNFYSPIFKESVVILHQYEDTDGRPLLRGHVAGTPVDDYVIFRPSELLYQRGGKTVTELRSG